MNPIKSAVGVVYGQDGAPKISSDFIANLTANQREFVAQNLTEHGYRLNDDNSVEKL